MKRVVKFIKNHQIILEGKQLSFREMQIVELEEDLALKLFREGIVLPGPSHGKPIKQ